MSENRSSSLLPFLLGFLAGAAVGLLLAPEKGESSRQKLKKKTEEIKDKVLPLVVIQAKPLVRKVSNKVSPMVARLEEMGTRVRGELQQIRQDWPEENPASASPDVALEANDSPFTRVASTLSSAKHRLFRNLPR